jgi:hypothetical protein
MSPSIQARSDDVGDVQDYLAKVKSTHESGECKTGGPQVMRRFPDRARRPRGVEWGWGRGGVGV